MSNTKVKQNIIFNVLKTLMSVLFPIITFTYVARMISVESLGKVSFAKNFSSYFCLLATLGIDYYGIREGAKVILDKRKFSKLFWEILTINSITTTISLISMLIISFNVQKLEAYQSLLLINAASVILGGVGCEWALSAHEEYKFISIRTMLVQLFSMIVMFITIKNESDYLIYAVLLVVSGYGASIFNYWCIFRKQMVQMIPRHELEFRKHLKPIFILFAMFVSINLYTLLDTTMLGFMKNDWSVGIYSAAIKIPRLVNSLIASVGAVLVPKLAFYCEVDETKFYALVQKAMKFVFLITIPCAIGVFLLSDEIILLLCGKAYMDASITTKLLAPLIMIIPISVLFNNQIFIPMRKELYVLQSTTVGAIVNMTLNAILIPRFAENGASVASVMAEFCVMLVCTHNVRKTLKLSGATKIYAQQLIKGLVLIPVILIIKMMFTNAFFVLGVSMVVCIALYAALNKNMIRDMVSGL